jgi:hypothetical protein
MVDDVVLNEASAIERCVARVRAALPTFEAFTSALLRQDRP